MRICLRVTAGPHEGRDFTFAGHDTFIVGRSPRAHFRLSAKDRFFSRMHFLVELNPPHCRLMDLGSRNGTCVNGKRVRAADLKDGDEIKAGRTILCVTVDDTASLTDGPEEPSQAAAVTPPPPAEAPSTRPPGPAAKASELSMSEPSIFAPAQLCPACGADLAAAASGALACPACADKIRGQAQPIPGYQLVRELGRGGMAVVHLAIRQTDGAVVALKMLTPAVAGSRTDIDRFLREVAILRELQHPNIVAFRDAGEFSGGLFFVMDYVPGTDAQRLLTEHGPLLARRAVGLAVQLLQALEYAHARGYVHRDIKPANLLVQDVGSQEVVKLADFGLARTYQASRLSGLTMTGDVGGTLAFMAPEQLTNYRDAKPAVDQYAASATLYTLLTGQPVHDLPLQIDKQLLMILQDDTVPIRSRKPDLPAGLGQVIDRALAREPGERYPDVRVFREALLAALK
jgi:serine/threonine-protein kinase